MATEQRAVRAMRVYALDPRVLSQEQIAVTFAMTSRSPEAFDAIAKVVSEAKAADFNEKWVVGYGHASVAEHAVLHMAVEDLSRLAADELEDNRLASYTEKSSRYQILDRGSYHVPAELRGHRLERQYIQTCDYLFDVYHDLLERTQGWLRSQQAQGANEKDGAYRLRIRRMATDHCRFVLPASTLTNVGMTLNARSLEHAITKLLSHELAECRDLGERLKAQGRMIAPTLVKYADRSAYMAETRAALQGYAGRVAGGNAGGPSQVRARLVWHDAEGEQTLAAALLYRLGSMAWADAERRAREMSVAERGRLIEDALMRLGPFDAPPRELEMVTYRFELEMDYGAYREYKRHRMQTYLPQRLTTAHGYILPPLVAEAGAAPEFAEAMERVARLHAALAEEVSAAVAEHMVTHAHNRRLLAQMNLREAYHLFKLRSAENAHFTIREISRQALVEITRVHPLLIKFIKLRE